ncbi:type VI immunity family protein [Sorangium sp. So ce269]
MPHLSPHDTSELTLVIGGTTALVPCISFTLYLEHTDGEGFLDFYERSRAAAGPVLTHHIAESMRRRAKINARAESMVPTWVSNPVEEKDYHIQFSGCAEGSGVTSAGLELRISFWQPPTEASRARGRSNWRTLYAQGADLFWPGMSTLRVTLPLDHALAQDPASLAQWVLGFSSVKRGTFLSGTCGAAVNHDEAVSSSEIRAPMLQRLAAVCRRYPGTEWNIPQKSVHRLLRWDVAADDRVPQIARASWLTLLGPGCVARLGGIDALSTAVSAHPALRLHRAGGGAVVQAGDAPSFGDPAGRDRLSAYRAAASVLRPLRMPVLVGPSGEPEPWVEEWQRALDEPVS